MYLPRALAAALVAIGPIFQSVAAHSVERRPLSSVTRIEEPLIHTPSHRVHSLSSFDLTFNLQDKRRKIRLSLSPNHDILSENAVIQYLAADGTLRSSQPIDRHQHRIFKGEAFLWRDDRAEWRHAGWARVGVHQDGASPLFEGAFRLDGDHHHIQTSAKYRQTRVPGDPDVAQLPDEYMVVWRDSDVGGGQRDDGGRDELKRDLGEVVTCSSDGLAFNRDDGHPIYADRRAVEGAIETTSLWTVKPKFLFGRQIDGTTGGNGAGVNLASSIGSTAGCPTTRKVALLGVATDCTYTRLFDTTQALTDNVVKVVNTASQLYESAFNISLGIHNLTISHESCPTNAAPQAPWNVGCSADVTITDRLNLFSKWRGDNEDSNAYWTLMSNCPTDSAVGLAWLGQLCNAGSQTSPTGGNKNETVAAANVVVHTSTEWQVFAHETGHTFGAVHDCTSTTCSDGTSTKQQCCPLSKSSCDANSQFIMNPSTGSGITKFSPCTIGNICSAIGRNSVKTGCLTNNRDVSIVTGSRCGNGIVESGEDCDCGGEAGCGGNPCCDPKTCKFTANSVCDPANEECCTAQCQFAGNGTVCRPSSGECDPAETCTGTSPVCPADVNAPDGQSCGGKGSGLKCASGQCTSRDLQCKTLMGSLTSDNDTYACPSQGCQLSCASPEFGPRVCYTMQQNFLDGTPCHGGGKCANGICKGSSWFEENKKIIIPVVAAVGALIVLGLLSCLINACRRRRRRGNGGSVGRRSNNISKPPPPGWNAYGPGAWAPGPPGPRGPPPMMSGGGPRAGPSPENWAGVNRPAPPQPPYVPPARSGSVGGQWQPPTRTFSERFA
ncbi:hypothetical protein VTK73DRAFT_3403 [Phialemonium thermophilum]|uniref:Disintegrin and metalloproteinase domain-containing protein B n=1 Tax=Phialemonium thermophilum TaxID=223376 RepID=A0ABR3WZF2_9PEZI